MEVGGEGGGEERVERTRASTMQKGTPISSIRAYLHRPLIVICELIMRSLYKVIREVNSSR